MLISANKRKGNIHTLNCIMAKGLIGQNIRYDINCGTESMYHNNQFEMLGKLLYSLNNV